MPTTYNCIATTTLTSTQTSVTFSSISASFTDLILVTNLRDLTNGAASLRFNNDSGNNYSRISMRGNGSTASTFRQSNQNTVYIEGDSSGSNFSLSITHLMNYKNTSRNKSMIQRVFYTGGSPQTTEESIFYWRSTAAINRIDITSLTGTATLAIGSTFSLYGIAAA